MAARTKVSATFDHDDSVDRAVVRRMRTRDSERLLHRANRLLRWYRALSRQAETTEITRAQASPFQFEVEGAAEPALWSEPIFYEATGPRSAGMTLDALTDAVIAGTSSGGEPDVAELFLLDADRALHEGRFRETVLFCWSPIDSTFNRKYDALVNAKLVGEWGDGRESLMAVDFGLRNKMTAVMHLVAGRSLFREPDNFWARLTQSYGKRNGIIHRGENATEDDARLALDVAQRVVDIMSSF